MVLVEKTVFVTITHNNVTKFNRTRNSYILLFSKCLYSPAYLTTKNLMLKEIVFCLLHL